MSNGYVNDKPFFVARIRGGQVEIKGEPHCNLGHRIDGGDGVFAEWHWDGETITATNDRYGFYPLYYYHDGDSFVVSPSLIRMMPFCRQREFDGPALGVYFRTGSLIGEDTPFLNIKVLGPGATLKWRFGTMSASGGSRPASEPVSISRDEAIERFNHLFVRAIEKRRPRTQDVYVALSGGRDSRHILLELLRQGIRPDACVTFKDFPDWRGQDLPVAQALVKAAGLRHVVLEQGSNRFESERRKNLVTDLCASRSVKMLTLADFFNSRAQTVYDGVAGMLAQSFFIESQQNIHYKNGELDLLTNQFLQKWASGDKVLGLVLSRRTCELLCYERAFTHLKEEVVRHCAAANPVASYYFWNRTRRDIALIPYAMFSGVPYVYSPYIDHDLASFLMSLPAKIIEDGTFHDDTIRRAYPEYAHIPFEDKSAPKPAGAKAHWASFVGDFSRHYFGAKGFRSRMLNNGYLAPRMLRSLVDGKYRETSQWLPLLRILNILQLEELADCRREY